MWFAQNKWWSSENRITFQGCFILVIWLFFITVVLGKNQRPDMIQLGWITLTGNTISRLQFMDSHLSLFWFTKCRTCTHSGLSSSSSSAPTASPAAPAAPPASAAPSCLLPDCPQIQWISKQEKKESFIALWGSDLLPKLIRLLNNLRRALWLTLRSGLRHPCKVWSHFDLSQLEKFGYFTVCSSMYLVRALHTCLFLFFIKLFTMPPFLFFPRHAVSTQRPNTVILWLQGDCGNTIIFCCRDTGLHMKQLLQRHWSN